jgi:hypothetical protein
MEEGDTTDLASMYGMYQHQEHMLDKARNTIIKLNAKHTKLRSAHAKLQKVLKQFKHPRRGPPRAAKRDK